MDKKPKAETPKPAAIDTFTLPDWIPPEAWEGYVAMRKKIKKPMTDHARDLVVKELLKLRKEGHEAGAVLEQSVRSSWTDVYPLKAKGTPTGGATASQWWDTDQSMMAKATELGLNTKGKSRVELRNAINQKLTGAAA